MGHCSAVAKWPVFFLAVRVLCVVARMLLQHVHGCLYVMWDCWSVLRVIMWLLGCFV